jgi:hypothetical protein
MKKQIQKLVFTVISLLAICVAPALPASAASSNGLGITPTKNYTVQPGGHVSDTLYVNNLSKTDDLHLHLRVIDFSAKDETGTPQLDLKDNAPQPTWSLKPFLQLPSADVTVPAGKADNIPVTVSVPAGQGAGSYYSAIEYTAQNQPGQQNVTLAASSVTLAFLNVPGQTKEFMTLKQFGAFTPSADDETGKFSTFFFGSQPKELAFRVSNQGNVAESPTGSILIKNIFGKQVKVIQEANPKHQLALRDQIRRFETCISSSEQTVKNSSGEDQTNTVCKSAGLLPGRYTAMLDVFYGQNGNNSQEIQGTATFWYLPYWFLIAVAIVILAIVFVVWRVVHKFKRGRRTYKK